jgi:hypothetical protein
MHVGIALHEADVGGLLCIPSPRRITTPQGKGRQRKFLNPGQSKIAAPV